jgi:hypothetical protein
MAVDDSLTRMSDIDLATMLALATHLDLTGTEKQRRRAAQVLPLINAELAARRVRSAIARARKGVPK